MQSSVWYSHFQGATYPLNLAVCGQQVHTNRRVKTLVDLSSAFIVQDASMTKKAVSILPQELCRALLEQAVGRGKDRAIFVLLSYWPDRMLSLRTMATPLYTSLRILYDTGFLSSVVMQGVRYTTSLAHSFMETLKKKADTKVKYLDLTGYPTAEVIVFYLSTHCMLVYNESRQNVMIDSYEAAVKLLPDADVSSHQHFTADQTLPDGIYTVKLDAFVASDETLSELCKALKVSSFERSRFKIILETVDVTCLGQKKISLLLDLLDVQNLLGLRLKYNSVTPEEFREMAPQIQRFTNLTSLDLSCNCINIYQNDMTCSVLGMTLGMLPNLVRLDLSNNRLKSKLRRTLSSIKKPLQYLRLLGCGLAEGDIRYLSECHHTAGLRELYLSENSLGRTITSLLRLLMALQQTLQVLELEEAALHDDHILSLRSSTALPYLDHLMFLNIAGNSLSSDIVSELCVNVCRIPCLQYVWIAYPLECYQQLTDEANEELMKTFVRNTKEAMMQERQRLGLTDSIPFLVTTELEQDMI